MTELEQRIGTKLEDVLGLPDPRPRISTYHDMPYAIFQYQPEEEFELRKQLRLLQTRLEKKGKQVHRISLAECLEEALLSQHTIGEWAAAEISMGLQTTIETVHAVLADYKPLVDLVADRLPRQADPLKDIVFILRTGALFPVYRTFSLLEQLKGKVHTPTILFYPGTADGPAGLRFMGVLEAEHNYRPKIL